MSLEAQEAVGSLLTGPGRILLPHATSCHVQTSSHSPKLQKPESAPSGDMAGCHLAWAGRASKAGALLSQDNPRPLSLALQPRYPSHPGPRSGLEKSMSLSGCRHSCHFYCEYFQDSLLPRKGAGGFSCSRDESTSGSGSGIAGLLRTLPCNSASRSESWGRGRCPRPPQPRH